MDVIVALVALTAMEIVLGIDNIVFIAILAGRLPPAQQPRARTLGLVAALGTRIILLLFLKQILGLTAPLFHLSDVLPDSLFAPEALPAARYDIVVADILAQPLMVLAPLLASRTAAGGTIVLSGLLDSQAAEVAAAYAGDFELAARTEEGWSALEGRRR